MLLLLTRYLIKYKQLCIPHIGRFQLLPQAPHFNVVDKMMEPPAFVCKMDAAENIAQHQLLFLSAHLETDEQTTKQQLENFGKALHHKVQQQAFTWSGVGTIELDGNGLILQPLVLHPAGLGVVAAEKVLRENPEHLRLVGNHEVSNSPAAEDVSAARKRTPVKIIIGLIVLLLAVLAIIYLLYKGNFNPLATGLRLKAAAVTVY